MSAYSLEEYTVVKHVMAELHGAPHKQWHRTVFARAPHVVRRNA
jgi:betaine-aldehyde dehydrogenase